MMSYPKRIWISSHMLPGSTDCEMSRSAVRRSDSNGFLLLTWSVTSHQPELLWFSPESLWNNFIQKTFHIVNMVFLNSSQIISKHNILHNTSLLAKLWMRPHRRSWQDDPVISPLLFSESILKLEGLTLTNFLKSNVYISVQI